MPLFASDFGAGIAVMCFGLVVFLAVVALSLVGIRVGDRLRRRKSKWARRIGTALIAVCCLLPFAAYYGPSLYTRVTLGRFPLGRSPSDTIREGMTRDEVLNLLGRPNHRHDQNGQESWYYYIDSLGADYYGIRFGEDGRVESTWVN